MTLNVETPRVVYTGSGTRGPFSLSVSGTPITYSASSHIKAERYTDAGVLIETLVEGVDYDLSATSRATGDSAATLTIKVSKDALSSTQKLVIYRESPLSQTLSLTQGGGFSSSANEANYDKIVRILQELYLSFGRQVAINPISSGIDVNLPVPAAGYVLGWNADGDGFENYSSIPTDTVSVSVAWAAVINKATIALGLTEAGFSAFIQTLINDADASAALSTLGFSTYGKTLIDDADEQAARATLGINAALAGICNGRLTLSSGVPVTTTDVTAATTLYLALYQGNKIALYDGSTWKLYTLTELSIAVPATTNTMYDVFVYDNAGTLTLELTAWTNDTTRATALTTQNGVYVKSGATTRRYLGSFRTTGVSGQTEDSKAKRLVWNMYNRHKRFMEVLPAVDSYNYTTATIRQMNADAANQLAYVCGLAEDAVTASCLQYSSNSTAGVAASGGIGVDSSTVMSGMIGQTQNFVVNLRCPIEAAYSGIPGIGYHELRILEYSVATGTCTRYGDNGTPTILQAGINGEVWG